jgi:pyruvate/2-oxoglutarate dehydrogenase complex dihydrolipoamide acyltransferase (E2) component
VKGSGPGGRIVERDVKAAAAGVAEPEYDVADHEATAVTPLPELMEGPPPAGSDESATRAIEVFKASSGRSRSRTDRRVRRQAAQPGAQDHRVAAQPGQARDAALPADRHGGRRPLGDFRRGSTSCSATAARSASTTSS